MNNGISAITAMEHEGWSEMNEKARDLDTVNNKIIEFKNFKAHNGELIGIEGQKLSYRFVKRTSDIFISLFALIILSPILIASMVAIVLDDGAPVIFKQNRSGLKGSIFGMYKFRSMVKNAPELHDELLQFNELDGPVFKIKEDPRITKVGKILRRTSLDELPQFFNVLIGDMSLVGPRPLPTYETELCNDYQKQRLNVKPGMTCYWQVSGRNNITFDEWIEMDLKYIREASVLTDFKLLCKTVVAVVKMIGAY